jgi:predicted extracellular nuclease
MRKLMFVVFCVILGAGNAVAQTTDLMITEYVEGSGNNKALEIYNGTLDVINLGGYSIERYSNGSTVAVSIALNAVDLEPGAAFVITNPLADAGLLTQADQTDGNINFNGDDALVLAFGGSMVIDSFGRVGEDPGSFWACADGNTANHTMRRLSGVCAGDVDTSDVFDPCDQWTFAPSDVFSGLGDHIADCGAVANEAMVWGELKALFR